MRKGSPLIWPTTVTVEFAPPVPTIGLTLDQRDALAQRVRAAIEGRLGGRTCFPQDLPGECQGSSPGTTPANSVENRYDPL
jgi:hypothetical protein